MREVKPPSRALAYFGTVTLPVLELPRGPVTVPFAVVEVPLFVVVPLTVDVLPFGPVTLPLPVVPVRVLAIVAEPVAVFPRAPVAAPLAVTELPFCVTEPDAVDPWRPVTVFCASAEVRGSIIAITATAVHFMFIVFSQVLDFAAYLTTLTPRLCFPHFDQTIQYNSPGSVMQIASPCGSTWAAEMVPPCSFTIRLAIASPKPVPFG